MPLSAELEKVLGLIEDPTEREARRKEMRELSEGSLRQADYSRKMNEFDKQRKEAEAKHKSNLEWFGKAKGQYDEALKDLKEAREKLAAAESGTAGGGHLPGLDDEDQGELQRALKQARAELQVAQGKVGDLAATVTNFSKMIDEGKLITAERFNEEVNKRGDALGAAVFDIWDLEEEHRTTFGTKLDRKALLEETQQRGGDLKAAYDFITAKPREEKLRKDIEAETEARWKEKMKGSNVPYAATGEPVLGPLQQRLQKKDTGIPDDVAADGSGRLANLVAQELRQEGKV